MKVTIRPLRREDAYTSVKWRNDSEVFRYTGNTYDHEITIESELAWIERVINKKDDYRCAIEVDGAYVGNIYLTDIHDGEAEYHIFIGNKEYWGKGVAKEASKQILTYAKEKLSLHNVILEVKRENVRAIELYKAVGFQFIKAKGDKWIMRVDINQEKPLVAIHCLVYNHEPYLRDCFEGFVMQKTNFRFVAVVHEDCSTDNSAAIIREYAEKYPEIFRPIFETENQWGKHDDSINKIMNDAIAATGAKYVAICEGDDYWTEPSKLQKQVDYMEAHHACSCYAHNSLTLNTSSRNIGLFNKKLLRSLDYTLENFITKDWFTPTQSLMYRREAYTDFGDEPRFMHGDYSILINILLMEGSYLHYENEIQSVYRNGGYASTHFNEIDLCNDFIKMLKYFKSKSNGRCDEVFDKQIARQKQEIDNVLQRKEMIQKSQTLHVRIWHWIARKAATIANRKIECVYVDKRINRIELLNIEQLD